MDSDAIQKLYNEREKFHEIRAVSSNDENYLAFIKILHKVLPIKIDEEYGKEVKEKTENENIYNLSGHTFSDISGNSEDKNAVRHFVGDIFDESKKNAN